MANFPNLIPTFPAPEFLAEDAHTFLNNLLAAALELPGARDVLTGAIVSGAITPDRYLFAVDTEGGADLDELDRINVTNLAAGRVIELRNADAARVVRVRSAQGGSGQIFLAHGGEFDLAEQSMRLWLRREADYWIEEHRHYGNLVSAQRNDLGLGEAATLAKADAADARAAVSDDVVMTPARGLDQLDHENLMIGRKATHTDFDAAARILISVFVDGAFQLRKMTLEKLLAPSFARYFETGELAADGGAGAVVAHDLGGTPKSIWVVMRNKIAQHGYNPGDEIVPGNTNTGGSGRLLTIGANSGSIFYRVKSGGQLGIVSASNTEESITPANWRLVIRAGR